MSFTHRVIVGLLLCLTLTFTAAAQGVRKVKGARAKKSPASKNPAPLTPEQQFALATLEQLFESVRGLDDEPLKIRTQARIADTLWPYDEPRARREFEESFHAAAAKGPELQSEVLTLISRRDADLAERLIKSVTGNSSDKEAGTQARRDLYLQAALSLAESDPERASQLAKAGLGGDINPEILKILFAMRASNPAAADELFGAALAVARRVGGRSSMNVATLAPYVLPEFTTLGAGLNPTQETPRAASALVREFLNFTYDTFLQLSGVAAQLGLPGADYRTPAPNPMDYMTGQRLLPSFVRYMPDKAANFRLAVDAVAHNAQQTSAGSALGRMLQPAGTDELLEQAQSERNKMLRDLLYTRAAMSAMTDGDFERALSIAEKLGSEDRRASLSSILKLQAAAALKRDDLDAALRYAAGVVDLRQRAYLYGSIARTLFDKHDAARAVAVLGDAERDIDKADDDAVKANALLIVAEVKTRIDPAQGFEVAGVAVKAFNRADSAGRDGRAPSAAGNTSTLTAVLNASLKLDVPNFEPVFVRLARVDFNRAAQLARTLERNDRSVSAQLAACQGALAVRQQEKTQTSEKK